MQELDKKTEDIAADAGWAAEYALGIKRLIVQTGQANPSIIDKVHQALDLLRKAYIEQSQQKS